MLVKTHRLFNPSAVSAWNRFTDVESEFNRLFQWGLGREEGSQSNPTVYGYYPPVNITEDAEGYTVEARVPGLQQDAIAIELEGRTLKISGEHKHAEGEYIREERATGRFERTFTFRHDIKADKIEARVKDGILTVVLPKADEAKARKIAVVAVK